MKSNLQKQKEKKYYSKVNETIILSLKIKIKNGHKIDDEDLDKIKGPDRDKIIDFLKKYYNNQNNKNKGIEF